MLECLSLASLSRTTFQCLWVRPGASPRVEHLAPALPANIRLGWKGLPGTNTLAFYENLSITAVKSFIVQATGVVH